MPSAEAGVYGDVLDGMENVAGRSRNLDSLMMTLEQIPLAFLVWHTGWLSTPIIKNGKYDSYLFYFCRLVYLLAGSH